MKEFRDTVILALLVVIAIEGGMLVTRPNPLDERTVRLDEIEKLLTPLGGSGAFPTSDGILMKLDKIDKSLTDISTGIYCLRPPTSKLVYVQCP